VHGELRQSQEEAQRGYEQFRDSNVELAWKFRILEARAAVWRGLYEPALKLLDSQPPPPNQPNLVVPKLTLASVANVYLQHFATAKSDLAKATDLCADSPVASCGDVLQASGFLASEQGESALAEQFYWRSLSVARAQGDRFLESTALLNLGDESLAQGHFDEAVERSEAAYNVARELDAKPVEVVAKGNIGWASYKLGDLEKALILLNEAEQLAAQLQEFSNEENELTNIGYVFMDQRKFDLAAESFQRALQIAQGIQAQEDTYNALRVLARLALRTGEIDEADTYAGQALSIAQKSGNHIDELYPILVRGQIAARRGEIAQANDAFQKVEQDKVCPVFLKWEAQHSLAALYEDKGDFDSANREYLAALTTFEAARQTVRRTDSQLSFLTNAAHIYDDYVHFLVARGKTDDALRWADYSRARALADGLGLLGKGTASGPPPLKPQQIAQRTGGTVLFYWLGEKQSYLWVITPHETRVFPLPPGPEIDAAAERYRKALAGPQEVLEARDSDGQTLYRMLISPAQTLLPKDAKIFVIPDGSLNNLNFETLLAPEPKLHYWVEDATIANASSLRMLDAASARRVRGQGSRDRSLLLIGNSVAPNDEYPELPRAAPQMEGVARHFPAAQERILARESATPAAYFDSHPEQFSYLHFVAHGTASRLSPLDSAIVLSKTTISQNDSENESFKLYARDIIQHPLRADLVTISACYGAGERAYSGEGLVGLSWAFLRAGSHNVVAALWEATDVSTEQLMDQFYDELDKGRSPDAALRAAKLSLLHSAGFHNPFYWAPFQLYTGA
jgi:CHAT domain-containing protein/Tfp pilus assembly protein PilF